MAKIYLASSWKNPYHRGVFILLQADGHKIYNFKSTLGPESISGPQPTAFSWEALDPNWEQWSPVEFRAALNTRRASQGYVGDLRGMEWADTCVLLLPCGRSAHLEAGYMKGRSKRLIIYIPEKQDPDLMYLLADCIVTDSNDLLKVLS